MNRERERGERGRKEHCVALIRNTVANSVILIANIPCVNASRNI